MEKNYKKATYFTFVDKCSQNGYTSTCLLENDLKTFEEPPRHQVTILQKRQCSSTDVKKGVCDKLGIKLGSLDFNETQKGKDQYDRDGAVAKRCMQFFCQFW